MSRSESRWNGRVEDPEHWRDGASPKYYVLVELDGPGEAFAMYRVKQKWERGMPQSELVLVDAIATSTEATRELWRYLFGVDLIAKVSLELRPGNAAVPHGQGRPAAAAQGLGRDLAAARGHR